MLSGVEHGDQDVQVGQQLRQRDRPPDRDREVRTLAPLEKLLIERVADGLDFVPERLEHRPQEPLAAPHRQHTQSGFERDRGRDQLRAVLAPALQGRPEHLGDGDAQERRGDVGAVVDVLCQEEVLVGVATPDQSHGIHVEQQGGGAAVLADFGVVGVGGAEAQVERLELVRVFVQQVAEIARRAVCGGDR